MFLRRAFVEGRHLPARLSLHPHLSFHRRAACSAARHIPQHATITLNQKPSQVHDPAPTHAFAEELERFRSVAFKGGEPIGPAFSRLRGCVNALSDTSSTLHGPSKELLEETLLHLCRSSYTHDHTVVEDGVSMVAQLLEVGVEDYAVDMFCRLVDEEDANAAINWLWATGKKDGVGNGYAFVLSHWHRLLEVAALKRSEYLLGNALSKMKRLSVVPTIETGRLIITAMFRSPSPDKARLPPSYNTMKHLINLFHSTRVPYDENTPTFIAEEYARAGEEDVGRRVELLYTSMLAEPRSRFTEARMNDALESVHGTRIQVLRELRRYQKLGLKPSEDTLFAVLGPRGKIGDYEYWRKTLGLSGGSKAAARVMENLLGGGGSSASRVVEFYELERTRGNTLSPQMLHFAIQARLSSTLATPSQRAVEAALALYRDFVHQNVLAGPSKDDPPPREHHPQARTYQLLLRTLTLCHSTKFLSIAITLVEDMRRFRVIIDSQTTASIIVLLMRASPTPVEAFEAYRLLGQPPDQCEEPNLDEEGYNAVLSAFCKLETWPERIPSPQHYFQIVADMRKHGLETKPKAYTTIISQLALLATVATSSPPALENGDLRTRIAKTIARVHNHLTLDANFTPDVALWNQLMNAYQRAGCFTEACRIWQKLFASRTFNNVSVSIIIDACAFNQAYDVGVRVFTGLVESGYSLNIRNWNTFLECLCRLDKIEEAMKVLCLEMPGREDGAAPDKESLRILLKFAAKHGQETEVRSKLKRFLPKLYYSLHKEMGH